MELLAIVQSLLPRAHRVQLVKHRQIRALPPGRAQIHQRLVMGHCLLLQVHQVQLSRPLRTRVFLPGSPRSPAMEPLAMEQHPQLRVHLVQLLKALVIQAFPPVRALIPRCQEIRAFLLPVQPQILLLAGAIV